ncbi:MAG TPA: beta-ketoacyl synthase N-terminal-like domain-containing protein, partial [Gemmatimonadales bacterium]|nr:beta-ketoacyl synthase N-terminal-like domain-containing protein [Gemmatimonadales bacterium]
MVDPRPGRSVAVVAGVRTPFAKSGTIFADTTAVALARHAARELLYRSEVDGREIDEVIFSQVVPSALTPNVAREVSLLPQLPPSVPAYTLNRACASAAQAINNAADQIRLGHADVVLAGGVESLSDLPILHSRRFSRVLVETSKARSMGGRVAALGRVRPRDLIPVTPAIAEPSTGESMGQSAEKMAKENGITREEQDRLALMSHQRAAAATADGRLPAEIAPWF